MGVVSCVDIMTDMVDRETEADDPITGDVCLISTSKEEHRHRA